MSAHDTHEHTARNCLWCKDIVDILEIAVLRCCLTNNLNYKTYKNTQQINAARAIVYKSPKVCVDLDIKMMIS